MVAPQFDSFQDDSRRGEGNRGQVEHEFQDGFMSKEADRRRRKLYEGKMKRAPMTVVGIGRCYGGGKVPGESDRT